MLATCADLEDVFGGRARRVSGADEGRVEARDVGPALAPRLDERHCLHQRMSAIWAPFSSGAQPTAAGHGIGRVSENGNGKMNGKKFQRHCTWVCAGCSICSVT